MPAVHSVWVSYWCDAKAEGCRKNAIFYVVPEQKFYCVRCLAKLLNNCFAHPHRVEHRELFSNEMALTPQQKQVIGLLREGKLNKEMADSMNISERTIKYHLGVLMKKLGVGCRHLLADPGLGSFHHCGPLTLRRNAKGER